MRYYICNVIHNVYHDGFYSYLFIFIAYVIAKTGSYVEKTVIFVFIAG